MIISLIRKFLYACLSLFIVATLTFGLMKAIPGDPFQQEQALPTEIYEALRTHYGLNDPLPQQYFRYIKQLLTFDLGPSLIYKGKNVTTIIKETFPTSALLGAEALFLAIPLGFLLGTLAAFKQNRWQDSLVTLIAVVGISVPSFIVATFLQYIFGIELGILPIARWGSFSHTILPALSLAALPTAFIARMTRTKMIEELQQAYITTARAKGLPNHIVLFRHAMRNMITPLLSYLGPLTASIMTGSFIIEKIYSIPGLGYWFVTSVLNRDYPLIMGITVFYCALLLLAAYLVEVACLIIDPRLREPAKAKKGVLFPRKTIRTSK